MGRDGTPLYHLSGHSGTRTRSLPLRRHRCRHGCSAVRAMCPVILFRITTGWRTRSRGGRTPFADRGGQWFRGRTNPDRQRRRRSQAFLPPHWRQTCPDPPQLLHEYPRDCFPVPQQDGHVFVPEYPMLPHGLHDMRFSPPLRRGCGV